MLVTKTFFFLRERIYSMPFAVTHVLLTIIAVDLYRDYVTRHKRYFTLHTIFIAGVAGLLPDMDLPLTWIGQIFNFSLPEILQHGYITHTAFFGLIFLIPGIFLWMKGRHKQATYFFAICFGILFHNFLDYFIGGGRLEGVMWFWPLSTAVYKLHLLLVGDVLFALDAVILLAWLWHEEMKHKISDFV